MSSVEAEIGQVAIDDGRWEQALADIGTVAVHKISSALLDLARESREAGELEMESLYAVLGSITSFCYRPEDPLAPYGPMMVMDGSRTAVPDDLRGSDLDALKQMLSRIALPSARALAADMLWIRRRDREAAEEAVRAYVESARNRPEGWDHDALDQIERAMQIVSMLGKGGADLQPLPLGAAHELLLHDPPPPIGYEHRLIEILVSRDLTEGLEPYLERSAARATQAEVAGNHNEARGFYELAALIADALDRSPEARDYRIQAAEMWVADAYQATGGSDPSFMRAVGLMEFAIKAYRAIGGRRDRVNALHRTMLEWQERIGDELHEFSTEVDLSSLVAQAIEKVSGKPLPQALVGLALVYGFRDVKTLRAEATSMINDHPLQYLFTRSQLDAKGRIIARPESLSAGDEDSREAAILTEIYSQAVTMMGVVVQGGIQPARRALVAEHPVTLHELLQLLGPSPFIPPGHERTYVKGIQFGLSGDFATSAQMLAPELENALREQMIDAGVLLPRLNTDATHEERSLGEVLYHERATEVFGEAKLLLLRAVLSNEFGANLRDRVAHGLMTAQELMSVESAFMWWLSLRLAVEPMISVVDTDTADAEPIKADDELAVDGDAESFGDGTR